MSACSRILLTRKMMAVAGVFAFICFFVMPGLASDRFTDHGNGTVTDNKTGLMWAAKDNKTAISWQYGILYCQNYSGGGYTDWRMPTLAELESLYDPAAENKQRYHVTPLIETSAQSIWAAETRGFKAARFNFTYGSVYWLRQTYAGPTRVLPVRSSD